MRRLTAKQKKLLDKFSEERATKNNALWSVEDLTDEEWEQVEAINDTEILYQEVNRYLSDKRMAELYGQE